MFGGNKIEEVKEILNTNNKELATKIDSLTSTIESNSNQLSELKEKFEEEISHIKEKNDEISIRFDEELNHLVNLAGEFERSIASFNNIKNRLDDILYKKINEIADTEINSVKKRLSEFDNIQDDFTGLVNEVNSLQVQIKKFNEISENIKKVDFTLHSHARDLTKADRVKLEVEKENERLKSIMAKMKLGKKRKNQRKKKLKNGSISPF